MPTHEPNLHIRALDHTDREDVASLLGRGMADNPMHVAVYGGDDAHRELRHTQLMRVLLASSPAMRIEGVRRGDSLVGVAASAAPGHCQPMMPARLRLLGRALTFGPRTSLRLLAWSGDWAKHDPAEPHVHLGPLSVDRYVRGRGIGSLMLMRHVGSLDAVGAVGYLETDRPEAVGFYRRFGYVVVDEAEVVGVRCWFMRRPAR